MSTLSNPLNHSALLATATDAASYAAHMIMDHFGLAHGYEKAPGAVVTDVDVEIERRLRRRLHTATGFAVMGEETGGELGAEPTWVIDPIDGTSNFITGNPDCAVLISLVVDNRVEVAVTVIPQRGLRYTAVRGGQLVRNGVPQTGTRRSDPTVEVVGLSAINPLALDLAQTTLRPRVTGSVGVNLAYAAQGIFSAAVSTSPHVWDNAAGALLCESAGLEVRALDGQEWTPRSGPLVAGTHEAVETVLDTMRAQHH
ncbi:myo-inositol-1(or 4)-monophosphatase [Corynebacterium renale]|uniref:inositol monophosphatase family protein n=1 Tax=Corynebacterium renale TaxID=1724 RepID=UPI000DA3D60C|nr:inositol monophosphatase [Corynebacterium renale]SQG64947.1 myo-inositol-1(or 4)-monophosphatase [Corynebacterium renale]STC96830.1 myo-inositol-1(or 4)-monophosphatase [Corynebacterium renale]